ncbi:toll/interleukin-1 receptor domain-containing protein [Streptomyces sp. NPDC000594]|uniref:toll/interleukin-1 receptor domain-containing protein n=1 Tax=Streptomyces sp. NPDC000594 TaxID=3154261 RepID=UPI00332CD487
MTQVFISHSAKRDPGTLAVIERVTDGLAARRFEVRVDMDALRPGDDWCDTLYQWLGECDAAVVFFNEAALTSFWVRREVNILLWRRALNPRFRVIPVLMGSMTSQRLRDEGFTDVLPVEFARDNGPDAGPGTGPDAGPGTGPDAELDAELDAGPDATERLADAVLERFPEQPAPGEGTEGSDTDPMRHWVGRIADQLGQAGSDRPLLKAARVLGIREDELGHVRADAGACRLLAHRMLGTVAGAPLKSALMELSGSLGTDQLNRLIAQLLPIWVNGESARHILPPPNRSGSRAVVLNACQQSTAQHYVDRAMCLQIDRYHVESAGGLPLGEDAAEELTEECVEAVRKLLNHPPGWPPERFRPREGVLHCLSVDVAGLRPAVVAGAVGALRHRFPWLVLLLLTGESVPDRRTLDAWRLDDLVMVAPGLTGDEEILGYQLTRDLLDLPKRLNGSWR